MLNLLFVKNMIDKKMKIITRCIILFLAMSSAAKADLIPLQDLYNTGTNNNGALLADGETDMHYRLVSSADIAYPGPETKICLSSGFPMDRWFSNSASSKWIGPRTDPALFNEVGVYVYRIQFDLSHFKHNTAIIRGYWSSDNNGVDILINGKSTGYITPIEAYYALFPFEVNENFVPGINTIDFVIYNVNACAGLRVEIKGMAEPKEYAFFNDKF